MAKKRKLTDEQLAEHSERLIQNADHPIRVALVAILKAAGDNPGPIPDKLREAIDAAQAAYLAEGQDDKHLEDLVNARFSKMWQKNNPEKAKSPQVRLVDAIRAADDVAGKTNVKTAAGPGTEVYAIPVELWLKVREALGKI